MDLYRIISELVQERDRLVQLIQSLEEHAGGVARGVKGKRRGRKSMDRVARQQVSERMKRYWEQRREEKGSRERGA
jgi:hypothetical protein